MRTSRRKAKQIERARVQDMGNGTRVMHHANGQAVELVRVDARHRNARGEQRKPKKSELPANIGTPVTRPSGITEATGLAIASIV